MTFDFRLIMPEDEGISAATYLPKHRRRELEESRKKAQKKYKEGQKKCGIVQVKFECPEDFRDWIYWYKRIHGFNNVYQLIRYLFWQLGFEFFEPDEIRPRFKYSRQDVKEMKRLRKKNQKRLNLLIKNCNDCPYRGFDSDKLEYTCTHKEGEGIVVSEEKPPANCPLPDKP